MKIQVKAEKAPSQPSGLAPKDRAESADDATLFQAVLRVIDDGCPCGIDPLRHPWEIDHRNEDHANEQRMAFADQVVAVFKRFKHED